MSMIDYRLHDMFTALESMLGKKPMYLSDAAKAGKVTGFEVTLERVTDSDGVCTQLQPVITLVKGK